MINRIVEAIGVALHTKFGDGCEIYTEETGQGLDRPCFFVQCLNFSSELMKEGRFLRRSQFLIRYSPPQDGERNRECCEAAEQLCDCLECITVDGLMRGTRMRGEIVGGILHYYVNYDYFACRQEETVAMGEMTSDVTAKGG